MPHAESYHHNLRIHGPYRAAKSSIPIEDVARRYTNLEPVSGKPSHKGSCPLHHDKTPSFHIYPPDKGDSGGRFHCFGCGEHGDVVDLEFQAGDYGELYEALLTLAYEFDVQLPGPSEGWKAKQDRQRPLRDGIEEVRAKIVHRRLYRLFRVSYLDNIEDDDLRREEAERVWQDLAPVARGYARQLGACQEQA